MWWWVGALGGSATSEAGGAASAGSSAIAMCAANARASPRVFARSAARVARREGAVSDGGRGLGAGLEAAAPIAMQNLVQASLWLRMPAPPHNPSLNCEGRRPAGPNGPAASRTSR